MQGRREFTEEISREGLRPEILHAAERSFRIAKDEKTSVSMYISEKSGLTEEIKIKENVPEESESISRPRRGNGFRFR